MIQIQKYVSTPDKMPAILAFMKSQEREPLVKSWFGQSHGGTHVKHSPVSEPKGGGGPTTQSAAIRLVKTIKYDNVGGKPTSPILADGSPDLWLLPSEVETKTRGRFPSLPIRLMNGKVFGPNRGYGLAHIVAEHSSLMKDVGLSGVEYVHALLLNASKIYEGMGRLLIESVGTPRGVLFVELRDEGGFYSVTSAYKRQPEGSLIWSGRNAALITKGFGSQHDEFHAAATARESASRPALPLISKSRFHGPMLTLEALADQTNEFSVPCDDKSVNDSRFDLLKSHIAAISKGLIDA